VKEDDILRAGGCCDHLTVAPQNNESIVCRITRKLGTHVRVNAREMLLQKDTEVELGQAIQDKK
jgi:hypothetical protein